MCENGACIDLEKVCDGDRDCERYDDENFGLCNCSDDKVNFILQMAYNTAKITQSIIIHY